VQLVASQYEKALIPILSYSKDHYYRIFFRCEKGKQKCDSAIKEHKLFGFCKKCLQMETFHSEKPKKCSCGSDFIVAGPLWCGQLGDSKLISKMLKYSGQESASLLETLGEEYKVGSVGFYSLSQMCKLKNKKAVPKVNDVLQKLKNKKIPASRTHFSGDGIRTKENLSGYI
ncbi:hypothetical protein KY308_02265, partial [Candidatus Woesearchaeota archaeon]|nr:hypothetical protein [Candidatus Woesearchaeota archaeon]